MWANGARRALAAASRRRCTLPCSSALPCCITWPSAGSRPFPGDPHADSRPHMHFVPVKSTERRGQGETLTHIEAFVLIDSALPVGAQTRPDRRPEAPAGVERSRTDKASVHGTARSGRFTAPARSAVLPRRSFRRKWHGVGGLLDRRAKKDLKAALRAPISHVQRDIHEPANREPDRLPQAGQLLGQL